MMASRLTTLLNKYERNYNHAYVTWYENGLDEFVEPDYNPAWILEGSPEVDWYRSMKSYPNAFIMRDGSIVTTNILGIWQARHDLVVRA